MFRKMNAIGSTATSVADTTYDNIRGQEIMTDPRVISDARRDFEDRGIFIEDDDELMRKWYDDQTYTNLNSTVGPFNAYQRAEAATPESRARQARLRGAYQKLPMFYQGGGVGTGTAIPSMAKAIVLDPLNVIGGFVGMGGKAVAKSAILASKAGTSPALAAAKTAAYRSAMYEGALGGAFGGVYSVGQQNVDIKLGLQDQFSVGRLAADVAGEAVFSGAIGAGIGGAAGAVFQGRGSRAAALADLEAEGAIPKIYDGDEVSYQQDKLDEAEELERAGDQEGADAAQAEADAEEAKHHKAKKAQAKAEAEANPEQDTPPAEPVEEVAEGATPQPREGSLTGAAADKAQQDEIDVSINPETGAFNDERIESFVQDRAVKKDMPVSNRLTLPELRRIASGEKTEEAKAARKLLQDKEVVEENVRTVTDEEVEANVEKIAEEQELDAEAIKAEMVLEAQNLAKEQFARRAAVVNGFTATQRKRYDKRVPELQKEFMEADPELGKDRALNQARGQAIDEIERGSKVKGRTGKRQTSTGKSTAAMQTAENAGRSLQVHVDTETGRTTMIPAGLQKIFKGTILPTRGSIARDAAVLEAKKTNDFVSFKAKAGQNVIKADGTIGKVDRNSTVIYDPISSKFFGGGTSEEAMAAVTRFYENDELGVAAKKAAADLDAQKELEFEAANGTTQLDIGQTSTALREESQLAAKSVPATQNNLVLTVRYKGDDKIKNPIRQLRSEQLSTGTISTLIGKYYKGAKSEHKNPENWDIFYAPLFDSVYPDEARSPKKLSALLDGRQPVPLSVAAAPATVDGDASRFAAPAFTEIAEQALPAPESAIEEAMFEAFRQKGRQMDTYRNLLQRENEILGAVINGMEGGMGAFFEQSKAFLRYMDRVLPQGVKYPAGTRLAAKEAVQGMRDRYPQSTIDMVVRILDGSTAEGAPVLRFVDGDAAGNDGTFISPLNPVGIAEADGSNFSPAGVSTRTLDTGEVVTEASGVIEINTASELHPAHIMLHEMAHWSMAYIMTPRMKLAFLEELSTYITPEGRVDLKRLGLADAPGDFDAGGNIKEIMANLFTKWASDKRFRAAFRQERKTFFAKISEVFKKAFKFFMGGVPEAFDPIFAPLLSDIDARIYRLSDFDNMPKDETAQAIMRRNAQTITVRNTVRDATSRDNYANSVDETLSLFHGLTNSSKENEIIGAKTGQGATGNNTGGFFPTKKFYHPMREALKKLHMIADDMAELSDDELTELSRLRSEGASGFGVTGGYNFDEAKTRQLAELFETEIAPLLVEIQEEMDPQFQLYALGQHKATRTRNRKNAEALKNAPNPQNKQERKKKQAEQAAKTAFNKTAAQTDEDRANQLAASDLLEQASPDELAQNMNALAENSAPDRAAAQRIKRQLDAGTGTKVVEDQTTIDLIETEKVVNDLNIDGVSINARPQVVRLQESMNARTELAAANMRQLYVRLLNVLGLAKDSDETIKDAQLAPLFGMQGDNSGEALGSSSPMFKRLRDELRKIGQGLENGTDVVPDLVVKVIRASEDIGADTIDGKPADQFMAMVVNELLAGRATADDIFPNSANRGALIEAAERYVDRVGYVVNGLISNEGLRQKYPGLMDYGHMLTNDGTVRPVTTVTSMGGAAAPQVAADAFAEAVAHGTMAMRTNIVRWTQGAYNAVNGRPQGLYVPVRRGTPVDNRGRTQTSGMFGMATYVSPDPVGALRTATPGKTANDGQELVANALMEMIADVDHQIGENRINQAILTGSEASAAKRDLTELLRDRERLLERLDQTGRSFDDVAPVVTNASKVANLSVSEPYQRTSPMMAVMGEAAFGDDRSRIAGWSGTFPDQFDGDDLYEMTKAAILAQGLTEKQAATRIKKALRAAGYEGVMGTIDDKGVNRNIVALFDGDSVRSLKSPDMKMDVPDDSSPRRMGADFFGLLASEKTMNPSMGAAIEDHLRFSGGLPSALTPVVSAMITGSRNTRNVVQRGWDATMRGASGRFKQAGMKFLDERFELFGTDHTLKLGLKLMSKIDRLNDLPGMPKGMLPKVANYMTTAAQGNPNYGAFKEPAPMRRIRAALIDPAKASALSKDEQQLYADLRGLFQDQLKEMQASGILVGNLGQNYFPQVWNPQIIRRKPDEFKSLMKAYYQKEQSATQAQAEEFADKIYNNITANESGVVDLDTDNAAAMIDSATFGRLLNFHSVAPNLLDQAETFMEQSLMATMVRYFDQTERAIQQAKKLGVNGHMVGDYAKAATEGREGMIAVLSTNKHFTINQRTVMPGGGVEQTAKVFTHNMLPTKTAVTAVDAALKEFKRGDAIGARKILEAAYRGSGPAKNTFNRRVDAVMGAMEDFKGEPAAISEDDLKAANGYSRVIMRKRADGSTRSAQNLTRNMRMFQNITLLSYAAITSFSDLALPIIRSGDFKAAWNGWSRYLTNKQYRDSIRQIGVNMDGVTHERMAQLIGDTDNVVQSSFFKMTGLTPWTNVNRSGSAAIGMEAMRHHMAAIQKMGASAKGSPAYNFHDRFLKSHGLVYDASQPIPDFATDEAYQRAVIRFVENTIFSPKPQDMPLYANTPWGGLAYQLKSFSIMYGRFAKDMMVDDTKQAFRAVAKGDFNTARKYMTRPTLMMTLGPAVAAGSLATKDVVMSRGGEDSQSMALNQERAISDLPFVKTDWLDEDVDAIAGWYLTSFMTAGGLGLFGDLLHDAVQQSDNGAFGQQRMAEAVLGPTYGMIFGDLFNVGSAAVNVATEAVTGEGSAGVQRQGVREVVSRIPALGGNRAFREGAVDLVQQTETKSSGVGGGPFKRTSYGTTDF